MLSGDTKLLRPKFRDLKFEGFYYEPSCEEGYTFLEPQGPVTAYYSEVSALWDGNLWIVVIVKICVNKQADSWLAAQEWTTNQKPGQQVETTLDMTTTHKFQL